MKINYLYLDTNANVYEKQKKYDKAITLLVPTLESNLKNFGENSPQVAITQSNLAFAHYGIGRKIEAKSLWQKAYQNYIVNFGIEYPDTIWLKNNA